MWMPRTQHTGHPLIASVSNIRNRCTLLKTLTDGSELSIINISPIIKRHTITSVYSSSRDTTA